MTITARRANCFSRSSASSPTRCATCWAPTGRARSKTPGTGCSTTSRASSLKTMRETCVSGPKIGRALVAFQKIRSDIGLAPDRIVVAEHAVGEQCVARNHGIFVELDRVQSDDGGVLAAVPFERCRARRLFAGCDCFSKNITFHEGFHGAYLNRQSPVDVEGNSEPCHQQNEQSNRNFLKCHVSPPIEPLERHPHQLR